jgi:hypothetical protein
VRIAIRVLVFVLALAGTARAQSPNATVNGRVLDTSGGLIADATIEVVNEATNVSSSTKTNFSGIYLLPDLSPATYRIQVSHLGFKTIVKPDVILNVRDAVEINFTLPIGAISETVTVEGGAPMVNTQDASVSTVIDRQFAENLPMNGRSFQSLIELAPGVVVTTVNGQDNGQFSINGQRSTSNYWMVDGVSANIGVSAGGIAGNGLGGTIGSFSALGGTNSLVSVDAMQEFRIQTSTFAPEFGRTPGGQISIVTRSGTNQFHGTAFDYFRNGVLDANNWFADNAGLSKPEENQNDFGGTLGGPMIRDRTFFFFSYEGLRLRLPQTLFTTVPDLTARQTAVPQMQPYLNAFPLPSLNTPDDIADGLGQFNASYANPGTLDAYSLRVDHKLNDRVSLFGRYNYSPSRVDNRGGDFTPLSVTETVRIMTQTATVGATWLLSPTVTNDARFNYSRTNADSTFTMDGFGGAVPLTSLPLPAGFTSQNASFAFTIESLTAGYELLLGHQASNIQRQVNFVDNLSIQKNSHSLKFGVDFRRLSPISRPSAYTQEVFFSDVPSTENGAAEYGEINSSANVTLLFRNIGVFAEDTWRVSPRLTMTYGLRWDVDVAPSSLNGPDIPAVTGYSLTNLSQLRIAPPGTPPFKTTYGNVAPRVGLAYQINRSQEWGRVLRGGFGVFYDLASAETGNAIGQGASTIPPFGAVSFPFGTFPFTSGQVAPPVIPSTASLTELASFNPNLKLPYTLEWNLALEQSLGRQQTISATYVGAVGRRLLQTAQAFLPPSNPDIIEAFFTDNTATSDYNALQIQFQRRLSQGLQALASYSWAHSIDDGSASSVALLSNAGAPSSLAGSNRGPSDFDIRNALSAGLTYDIPTPKRHALGRAILRGWSTESFVVVRSAPPVNVYDGLFFGELGAFKANVRPDVVPGIPLYLYGSQYPGGKIINNTPNEGGTGCLGPFCLPPVSSTGAFLSQGSLGRNALRGFGASQWDFAVHRDFPIREPVRLQFRAEMFNIFNHPNFGPPNGAFGLAGFGESNQTLAQSLSGGTGLGAGGFNPLYQMGGPRSVQLALKLTF